MLDRDPKRRRLTPLNAPFRSPLRRPSTPTTSTSSANPSTPSNLNPRSNRTHFASNTPNRHVATGQFKSPVLGRNDEEGLTPEILALLHRKRELEAQIKEEKKALETAEIAVKYEQQDIDDGLEKLIVKWRRCAQKAAERVFVYARNRIDRMGGFREFVNNQKQRSAWDDEEQQREEESQEERQEDGQEEDIGDEFTMEIMLKMAGVSENLIGWDRELNNFVKE